MSAAPEPAEPDTFPHCPACAAEFYPGDRFCERCGTSLTSSATEPGAGPRAETGPPGETTPDCPSCGGTAILDGYCLTCGLRRVAARPEDRIDLDLGSAAGVSDLGIVHRRNEDGFGLALVPSTDTGAGAATDTGPAVVAVVCDGVSTAPGSGPAAQAAARDATTALAELVGEWSAPPGSPAAPTSPTTLPTTIPTTIPTAPPTAVPPAVPVTPPIAVPAVPPVAPASARNLTTVTVTREAIALRAAAATAQHSVAASVTSPDLTPACTFVAAIVTADLLVVGWLGDSRAYLFDHDGPRRLTEDDTLAAESVRAGLLPPHRAERGPGAHTITHWIGAGSETAVPRVVAIPLAGPGRVLLCSDGLWNYTSAAATLAGHIAHLPPDAPAIDVARHLTSVALAAGGADNITVVVIDIPRSS